MTVREPQAALVRVGVDLVETEKVARLAERFPDRLPDLFTAAELAYALRGGRRSGERLAARFAAKEAAFKALGTGMSRGVAWTEIGIERELSGRPRLELTGRAAETAARLGLTGADVSLSHTRDYAIAHVVLYAAASDPRHDGGAGTALRPEPLGRPGAGRAGRDHHQLTHHRQEH